jgi:hypothetical protein
MVMEPDSSARLDLTEHVPRLGAVSDVPMLSF